MQKERLQDEFAATLNMFQAAQRSTAQKEKEQVNKAKAQAFGDPFLGIYVKVLTRRKYLLFMIWLGGYKRDDQLIELQDSNAPRQQQIQEEADLRALQEQEQSIRQLEVNSYF